MIAQVKKEYLVICPIETKEEEVDQVTEQICQAILEEEKLKMLGINIDDILDTYF